MVHTNGLFLAVKKNEDIPHISLWNDFQDCFQYWYIKAIKVYNICNIKKE